MRRPRRQHWRNCEEKVKCCGSGALASAVAVGGLALDAASESAHALFPCPAAVSAGPGRCVPRFDRDGPLAESGLPVCRSKRPGHA
jgi:hypothetical protein